VSQPTTTKQTRRGRPRSTKARDAILDAASELVLARGLEAVSMDAVAEHAGASKATIYRWWPTKESLVLDALYREWDTAWNSPHDTGSLRGDLLSLMLSWTRRINTRPYGGVIAALLAKAQTDPSFREQYHKRFLEPRRDAARALFTRAIERGEIPPDTSVDLTLDLIYGALYHRLLHGHAPLNERFVKDVVDAVLPRAVGSGNG
jgi:AcrR family transcriptional regulator